MRMWPPGPRPIYRINFLKTLAADSEALLLNRSHSGTSNLDQRKGVSGASESICCDVGGRFVEDFVHGRGDL